MIINVSCMHTDINVLASVKIHVDYYYHTLATRYFEKWD